MDNKRPYQVMVQPLDSQARRSKKLKPKTCSYCNETFTRHRGYLLHCKSRAHIQTVAEHQRIAADSGMTAATSQEDVDMINVDDDAFSFGGDVDPVDSFAVDSGAGEQPGDNSDDGVSVDDDGEDRYDSDAQDDDEVELGLNSAFTSRFRHIMERDVDLATITDAAGDDLDATEQSVNSLNAHPFPNLQTMILHAFIYGDDDMVSRPNMQKVLYLVAVLIKIYEKSPDEFKLPALDALYNYDQRKRNKIPVLDPTEVAVDGPNPRSYHLHLPSAYLKLLVANPSQCKRISALPDYTPNHMVSLQQGQKWRTNPLFQQPVMSVNGQDFWIGDIVSVDTGGDPWCLLLDSYFSRSGQIFGRGYKFVVFINDDGIRQSYVEVDSCDVPLSAFRQVKSKEHLPLTCLSKTFSVSSVSSVFTSLTNEHRSLLSTVPHRMKKEILDVNGVSTGLYYKVKIVPLNLFTDDTSGNISKQFNKFDSWSMVCAALSFEDRNRRENTFFLGAVSGTKGLCATDMVPRIAEDMMALEKGVVMYSAEHGEDVLVIAPLLFITADNPRHSELVGLLGSTTTFPCRFCYYQKPYVKSPGNYGDLLNKRYSERTRNHYCMAAQTSNRTTLINCGLERELPAKDIGYKNKGADGLLKLQSFDPSKDAPVEILHSILLGIAKYLVEHLVKHLLKQDSRMKRLGDALDKHANGRGFSRNFRRNLRHQGSFLGRDFKALTQVLPFVISKEFTRYEDADVRLINRSFIKLGVLSSLVFVRSVHGNIREYIECVDMAVQDLTTALDEFDATDNNVSTNFAIRLKAHLLHHLPDNIARFGPPLHYETEKGEQFNKFIREHIVNTNRHSVSRDIAKVFGKQAMLRHIAQGGSWTNNDGNRDQRSNELASFIDEEHGDMFPMLFGGFRDYQDNDDLSMVLVDGRCGVFSVKCAEDPGPSNKRYFIGKAVKSGSCYNINEYFWMGKDQDGNPVVRSTNTWHSQGGLMLEGILDMDDRVTHCVVNQFKFGSYWMLNTLFA
ncbi:hypothetical protein [Absidia glauca]|uniref:C2H2-type domain-containing protein n=1 Tax=Absidia glauca TaxID=4829 RepID=A0A163KD68_ABSGL|nr:hypothetical protein [Absidia glauca]